ncbi:NAD dehydrogenase [Flagelloscypha sp. PMI_526]|nr:NAD dehydrogenase [Flagelloscypha sp. PMI_526]
MSALGAIRPLRLAINQNKRWQRKDPEFRIDFLVVGAGVVGLAIAKRLSEMYPSMSTFLVERNKRAGEETSSRNSEVIHSGLYYHPPSLKTRLCIRGRDLLYEYCQKKNIPFQRTGKLVVATSPSEVTYLEHLLQKSQDLLTWPPHSDPSQVKTGRPVHTELIPGSFARELEPSLNSKVLAALLVKQTGIVDAHTFMAQLELDFISTEDAEASFNALYATRAVRLDRSTNGHSWVVQTLTSGENETSSIEVGTVINCAGLSAPMLTNAVLDEKDWYSMFFPKGSYTSYKGPGIEDVKHLIYPCPPQPKGTTSSSFESLGTHLTLDLQGKVKFGPNLEWLKPPSEPDDENMSEFWRSHLVPDESVVDSMYESVRDYLPGIVKDNLAPDYCGIRPKIVGPGHGFCDFIVRTDYADRNTPGLVHSGREGWDGRGMDGKMISLLGIESPGLTSSLALAEFVVDDVLRVQ